MVTQLDHQNNKDCKFHDNCHCPHPTLTQLELRIFLWKIYINLTQLWPSVDHISDCFPIIIVWVETGKQKNNKSINIPWVRNVIYVVNNPEIPFVHLPRQLKKDNCSYNGRKLGFSERKKKTNNVGHNLYLGAILMPFSLPTRSDECLKYGILTHISWLLSVQLEDCLASRTSTHPCWEVIHPNMEGHLSKWIHSRGHCTNDPLSSGYSQHLKY